MTIELDTTLAQAEVLFLSFAQLVADVDRRRAEESWDQSPGSSVRKRGGGGEVKVSSIPEWSEDLRNLLKTR